VAGEAWAGEGALCWQWPAGAVTRPDSPGGWVQTLAAEKQAIALGILDRCPHEGVMGPCTRAARHPLPHAVPDRRKGAGFGQIVPDAASSPGKRGKTAKKSR
jgi:hypothetical protein